MYRHIQSQFAELTFNENFSIFSATFSFLKFSAEVILKKVKSI